jgi:uroporphyrinogen-III synthase
VAITRPREQAGELAEIVAARGGTPRVEPTVEIRPVRSLAPVKEFAEKVIAGRVDYVLFMSRNTVGHLLEALSRLGMAEEVVEALGRVKVVAIGSGTRMGLEGRGVGAGLVPKDYSSEGVADLFRTMGVHGKSIAVLRARNSSPYLKRELVKMFAHVLQVPVYESTPPSDEAGLTRLINELLGSAIDVITFTSSATARNLFRIAEEHNLSDKLRACLEEKVVVAAIGPVTRRALEKLGVKAHVVPSEYTVAAMIDALEGYLRGGPEVSPGLSGVGRCLAAKDSVKSKYGTKR